MKERVKEIFLGFVMGIANLLPGISGGTIVFISGRYPDFVESLGELVRLKIEKEKLLFLINLGLGIAVAILALSNAIDFLYTRYPKELRSFFAGLVMGGLISIGTGIEYSIRRFSFIGLGALVMLILESLGAGGLKPTALNLLLGGAVAGAAMILPGISGSSMLVIFGLYEHVVSYVARMEMGKLAVFGFGVLGGVILISVVLKTLMERNSSDTMAFLFGLTSVGLIFLLLENISFLYLVLGIAAATTFEKVMKW